MNHILTFRNTPHHIATGRSPVLGHPSRIGRALNRWGNAVNHKVEVLAQKLAEHRQRVELADKLADMDDRMLEDLGLDPTDMRVLIARAKRERKRIADFYTSNTLL